jgi:hypothetical protein
MSFGCALVPPLRASRMIEQVSSIARKVGAFAAGDAI